MEEGCEHLCNLFHAPKEEILFENIKCLGEQPLLGIARCWKYQRKVSHERLLWLTEWLFREQDVDVNDKDELGWTALAHACRYHGDDTRFVELLLKRPDIDVNCQDKNGWTPLMNACRNVKNGESSLDIVKLLLAHPQIKTWLQNTRARTASWICALHADAETFETLINSPRYEIYHTDFDITCLVTNCFKQRDFDKKMQIMLNCPVFENDKTDLWLNAAWWGEGHINEDLLEALCYVLEHNLIRRLKIPRRLYRKHHVNDKVFERILRGIEGCTSLYSVIFMDFCRPEDRVWRSVYESVLMNPAIRSLPADKFKAMEHRLFERINSLAFEKCRNATFLVLLGFRRVLGRDVAKIIAKLVWATRGTRCWHEEDYIFPGERWRMIRLCSAVSLQLSCWND